MKQTIYVLSYASYCDADYVVDTYSWVFADKETAVRRMHEILQDEIDCVEQEPEQLDDYGTEMKATIGVFQYALKVQEHEI